MDLSKFQNIVRRYFWLFVLAPLVASLSTILVISNQPPSYRATTRLLVGPGLDSPTPDLNSLRIGGQLTQTYAELANTRAFLESVNSKLDQKTEIETLNRLIQTRQNVETRLLTIVVFHPDPNQAVAIANAAAQTFLEISPSKDNTTDLLRTRLSSETQQLEEIVSRSEATIQQLEAELAGLKSVSGPSASASTQERINLLSRQLQEERAHWADSLRTLTNIYQLLLGTNTNQLEIIEPAGSVSPVNNDLPLKAAASGIAGLILAVIIAFALEYSDDTIRSAQELSRAAQIPLLSNIEGHSRLDGSGLERAVAFAQPASGAANSYRTAVSKLLFSIGDSIPSTLLVSSVGAQSGDDAAAATMNLAVAFAQAGHQVVVVDSQFHDPVLTNLFNADNEVGLSDLLIAKSLVLQLKSIDKISGIRLLPAGLSAEAGSAAALNPTKIGQVLEELQREASIILVAGSPIASSAESLTLASQANGVILVVRQGESRMKTVNEVIESLNAMKVQLTGIIFDENPTPFLSRRTRNMLPPITLDTEKGAVSGIIQAPGRVGLDTTPPSILVAAPIPADENIEPTSLDQADFDTVQTLAVEDLPVPTDEMEPTNLATAEVDLTQPQDLEAALPADENTELSNLGQDNVDIAGSEQAVADSVETEDLEAPMPVDENVELPTLDPVDADTMPTPDRADVGSTQSSDPGDSAKLSQENLELALLDPDVEKAEADHANNPNGSHKSHRRRSHRH